MPFKAKGIIRKCKYCDLPAKIHYHGLKKRHKGYYRTCGNKECLSRQWKDKAVNLKKSYISRNIQAKCAHCNALFIKEMFKQKWCKTCVPNKAARMIIQRYNLSFQEYNTLLKSNNYKCEICNKNGRLIVDHCHKSNIIRGAICDECNHGLYYLEKVNWLSKAKKYLKKYV